MQTVFEFTLPWGYLDEAGQVHQHGRMRLALARDEIEAMHQAQQRGNVAYLPIYLLARVVLQVGTVTTINPSVIENLYAADLAYLSEFYLQLNTHQGEWA